MQIAVNVRVGRAPKHPNQQFQCLLKKKNSIKSDRFVLLFSQKQKRDA